MFSKKVLIILLIMVTVGLAISLNSTTHAACLNGTGGSDPNLTCDDNSNANFAGGLGDDTLTITATGNVANTVSGDDAAGVGGNDSITNNGTVGNISGDAVPLAGGHDTIINNGTVTNDIFGDLAFDGGHDVITNNGTAGNIFGDSGGGNGGNDVITNNGTVANIAGDAGTGAGGNDTIINNSTVTGDIRGDTGIGAGGNDLVIIQVGSTVGGVIDGDGGNDTLEFTNIDAAAVAIINACLTPANCDIVIGTKTYRVRNIETLRAVLLAVAQSEDFSGVTIAIPREFCSGLVKAFRLVNGDVEVYSGFDLLPPNGFLVGVIPNGQTGTFSNNDKGWSLTIGADGRIRVFDTAPNLVSDQCVR